MKVIANSFKRQIGRDAGKVVSNLVWGDRHSTPVRRVTNRSTPTVRDKPKTQRQIRAEQLMNNIEAERLAKLNNLEAERLSKLNNDIKSQIIKINGIQFNRAKADRIVGILNEISVHLDVDSWETVNNGEEDKLKNKLSDAFLKKYKQGLTSLQSKADKRTVAFHTRVYKKFKRKRFYKKYQPFVILVGMIVVPMLILFIASIF